MTPDGIGVVGAGIAGLHLSLFLQQHGVPVTLYSEATAEEQRAGRLPNTVVHWHNTRRRERALAVNHWDDLNVPGYDHKFGIHCVYFCIGPPQEAVRFRADPSAAGIAVDQRIITSTLLEDFEKRGGDVAVGPIHAEDLTTLTKRHQFVVVSAGRRSLIESARRGSLTELFPRLSQHCPYDQPQRLLSAVIVDGIPYPDPIGITSNFVPGVGELFELPMLTFEGFRTALLFESVPGGPGEALTKMRYDEDPQDFERTLLGLLEQHMPAPLERLDRQVFRITRSLDVLQGAITPTHPPTLRPTGQ
jgi:2-polyprenyl-6-methoxyphenol hydroxylase-like FAD-dependent oxidoreductase